MSTTYATIQALVTAERGNTGHVVRTPDVEFATGEHCAETFRLENLSGIPGSGARRDVVGWFDGTTVAPITRK